MKKIMITAIVMIFVAVSCNQKSKEKVTIKTVKNQEKPQSVDSVTNAKITNTVAPVTPLDYTNDIITCYLNIKNKLAKDDPKGAAENGKLLLASFNRFDTKTLNAAQKKEYLDIADDAKEHAEHIGANGDKLEHQREHFVLLSKDINDLIKIFGSHRQLYQDYCPMANDGKGAIWISEVKDIKNPYQGSKMLACGSVKKIY